MDVTTSKQIFFVPAIADSDGTFRLWPHFHRSPVFTAAGHEWSFSYYPDSVYNDDSVDLCLHLESEGAKVTVSSVVGLVHHMLPPPPKLVMPSPPLEFDSNVDDRRTVTHWVPKSSLIKALRQGYTQDQNGLLFEWIITVLPETPMRTPEPEPEEMPVAVPEPEPVLEVMQEIADADARAGACADMPILNLLLPLPKVPTTTEIEPALPKVVPVATAEVALEGKVIPSTDVMFSVGGNLSHAHKAILSMRSPVFKVELSGSSPAEAVEVDGMAPDVFEALLHYVYTDTLLATTEESQSDEDAIQTTCNLLVAADRYGMDDGLKHLCEARLAKMVDADNVADMLALADEKFCLALQDACIGFLMAPGRMKDVVASQGYQRLRMKHPSILVDVLEKSLIDFTSIVRTTPQRTS